MQIPHDSFVLVADGRKSLFFRNEGDGEFPNLIVEEKEADHNPPHGEQASDLAGRAANTRGSSMEEVDFHQQEEDRFAAATAAMLKDRALSNDYESLIVVAPPHAIGILRRAYSSHVRQALRAEVEKDFVKLPVKEIERHLCH